MKVSSRLRLVLSLLRNVRLSISISMIRLWM